MDPSNNSTSPIDLLPPELIAEILLCCLRDCSYETRLRPDNPPWTFGKVSRRWRSITLNTPALWTDLPLLSTKTRNHNYRRLLGTALKLSKPLPITIDLTASLSGPDSLPPDMPLLHDVLPHLHRCRDLSLSVNPFAVHELSNMSISFNELTTLSLRFFGRDGDWDGVTDHLRFAAPKLKHLTILNEVFLGGWVLLDTPSPFIFQWLNVPWTGLTTFVGSYVSLDFACEVLKNAPSLRELSLEGLYHSGVDLPTEPIPVNQYSLETLFLLDSTTHTSGDAITRSFAPVTLLNALKLPQLRHFKFDYTPRMEYDPVTDLIQRSGCVLISIHIHIPHYWTIEELRRFYQLVPQVQDLIIRPPQDYTDAQLVLCTENDDEECRTPPLPELRHLTIVSSQITARGIHDLIDSRTHPCFFGLSLYARPLETVSISIARESAYWRVYETLNNFIMNPYEREDTILEQLRLSADALTYGIHRLTEIKSGKHPRDLQVEEPLEDTLSSCDGAEYLPNIHARHVERCRILDALRVISSILEAPVFQGTDDAPQTLRPKVDTMVANWTKAFEDLTPSKGWQHVTPNNVYTMRFETMCGRKPSGTEQVPAMSYALEKAMAWREAAASRLRLQVKRPERQGSNLFF